MFKIQLDDSVNSLRRLKERALEKLHKINYADRAKINNYKGFEIDDNDIQYLNDNDSLYLSLDGI
jgi:hypothetical protein